MGSAVCKCTKRLVGLNSDEMASITTLNNKLFIFDVSNLRADLVDFLVEIRLVK